MLSLGVGQNFHYVSLDLGIGTFVEAVDNHETTRGWFIEKACLYQLLKRFNDQGFQLHWEGLGKDKWVAFDSRKNGVSNIRNVQGNLVGNGGDKWLDTVARRIVPREKEACEQNHFVVAHLGDSLCDRRFASSGGAIHPHNE